MEKETILEVLAEIYPGEVPLRPDAAEKAVDVALGTSELDVATSDHGDPFLTPETMELLIQATVFIAAIVNIAKDVKDLFSNEESKEKAKKKAIEEDERLSDLTDEEAEKIIDALSKRHLGEDQ